MHKIALTNDTKPNERFIQFLKYDAQFMGKILITLGRSRLRVIRRRRCAEPKYLSRDMFPSQGFRQRARQTYISHCKFNQTLFQIIRLRSLNHAPHSHHNDKWRLNND